MSLLPPGAQAFHQRRCSAVPGELATRTTVSYSRFPNRSTSGWKRSLWRSNEKKSCQTARSADVNRTCLAPAFFQIEVGGEWSDPELADEKRPVCFLDEELRLKGSLQNCLLKGNGKGFPPFGAQPHAVGVIHPLGIHELSGDLVDAGIRDWRRPDMDAVDALFIAVYTSAQLIGVGFAGRTLNASCSSLDPVTRISVR